MNRNYNVLILSAGRRVELVKCFRDAAIKLNIKSSIIAADCSPTAPALFFSDESIILPRIDSPDYIDALIKNCNRYKISLIVPTIDTDLQILADNRYLIESRTQAVLHLSSQHVISICRDKIKTQEFLENNGFKIPKSYDVESLNKQSLLFPLFIKPKSGSSSIHAYKVNSIEELNIYLEIVPSPILQDFMAGEEYTVDAFVDFEGNPITIVPRLRMAVRSGEISKGKIVKDPEIIEQIKTLISVLKPIGHITVQLMKTVRGVEFIEINPRFGGGAPMSIMCGADSCECLYRLLMGEKLVYHEMYKSDVMFFRFDQSIMVNRNLERML